MMPHEPSPRSTISLWEAYGRPPLHDTLPLPNPRRGSVPDAIFTIGAPLGVSPVLGHSAQLGYSFTPPPPSAHHDVAHLARTEFTRFPPRCTAAHSCFPLPALCIMERALDSSSHCTQLDHIPAIQRGTPNLAAVCSRWRNRGRRAHPPSSP